MPLCYPGGGSRKAINTATVCPGRGGNTAARALRKRPVYFTVRAIASSDVFRPMSASCGPTANVVTR